MNQGQVGLFRSPCRCLSRLVSRLTGLSRSDLVPLRRVGLAVPAEVADGLTGERLHGEEDKLAVVEAQGVRRDQQLTDSVPAGCQQEHWQKSAQNACGLQQWPPARRARRVRHSSHGSSRPNEMEILCELRHSPRSTV